MCLFKKKSYKISIRNFEPKTASNDEVIRKIELRDEIKKQIKNLDEIKKFCLNNKLSVKVWFYLWDSSKEGIAQPEGQTKKDLDNMLKIVLDVLPEKMDNDGKNEGLGLIEGNKDEWVCELYSVKKIVYHKEEQGMDIEISKWKETKRSS